MKFKLIIDSTCDEEVVVYAHEKNDIVEKIEKLILQSSTEILGYIGATVVKLSPDEITCFVVEGGKVYALVNEKKLMLKYRLYQLEEFVGADFVKINQSCLANVSRIKRFDASIGGALLLTMDNGYTDYISRRQLKTVKERIGL